MRDGGVVGAEVSSLPRLPVAVPLIEAGSLAPLMVTVTSCEAVPSALVTVKLSVVAAPAGWGGRGVGKEGWGRWALGSWMEMAGGGVALATRVWAWASSTA